MTIRGPAPAAPLRHWSAWLPVTISLFFIALALRHVVQVLVTAYFAYTWLPKSPRFALGVLAVQFGAAAAVVALVYWLEHA